MSQMINANDGGLWDAAVQRWKEEGWNIEGLSSDYDGFTLTCADGNPAAIDVGFDDGHYYIQAQYEDDADFSKQLKQEKGGRRTSGTWWKDLDEPYAKLPEGKLAEALKSNRDFQQYIVERVNELKGYAALYHWKAAVAPREKWEIWIYRLYVLVCDLNLKEEGKPYMDILKDDKNGNVAIWLSNRVHDADLLQKTLMRIGCQDKEIVGCSVLLEVVPTSVDDSAIPEKVQEGLHGKKLEDCLPSSAGDTAVPERVKYWIERIESGQHDPSSKEDAQQKGKLKDFAAIDFETANKERTSVCSLGLVIVRDGAVANSFYSLIRPEPNYYTFTWLHGLTKEATKDAPLFPEVWAKAAALIGELPLVAHNSPFDEGCLKAAFELYGMDYPGYKFYCTCRASRAAFGNKLPNHQLSTVAAHCGYNLENHHNALADAEACAHIAIKIL